MTLDLKTVRDHPATLLERGFPKPNPDNDGVDLAKFVGASVSAYWVGYAADGLRQYEDAHNVTFAALDNDALADVREAYKEAGRTPVSGASPAAYSLYCALDALLGLDS